MVVILPYSGHANWDLYDELFLNYQGQQVKGKIVRLNKALARVIWRGDSNTVCGKVHLSLSKDKPQKLLEVVPLETCVKMKRRPNDEASEQSKVKELSTPEDTVSSGQSCVEASSPCSPAIELEKQLNMIKTSLSPISQPSIVPSSYFEAIKSHSIHLGDSFRSFKEKNLSVSEELSSCSDLEKTRKIKTLLPLGRGLFGYVYSAQMKGVKNEQVMKIIPNVKSQDFINEIAIAEILGQELAPKIEAYYLCRDENKVVGKIIMEKLEGTLGDYLNTHQLTQVQYQKIQDLFDKMHAKQVVHRDVKPDNIGTQVVDGELKFYLIDFGHAKVYEKNDSQFEKFKEYDHTSLKLAIESQVKK